MNEFEIIEKLGFSYKESSKNNWDIFKDNLKVGSIVKNNKLGSPSKNQNLLFLNDGKIKMEIYNDGKPIEHFKINSANQNKEFDIGVSFGRELAIIVNGYLGYMCFTLNNAKLRLEFHSTFDDYKAEEIIEYSKKCETKPKKYYYSLAYAKKDVNFEENYEESKILVKEQNGCLNIHEMCCNSKSVLYDNDENIDGQMDEYIDNHMGKRVITNFKYKLDELFPNTNLLDFILEKNEELAADYDILLKENLEQRRK